MSKYQGGMIGSVANATSGTAYTGRANGVFPLPQQIVAKSSSLWAIGQTRPNPPTIGTATGTGTTTISVAFIPPVQNGGSAITSYTVTSSGGQTATGASSPIVVSGLTSTTYYTFTVTATNALGTSDSSATSNSVQPAITDPYFSSVSLLLNGDGTNGSTTFTDLSSTPKTITVGGNAQISTAVKKYGTGAMYFDGGNTRLNVTSHTNLNLTDDFTIEFWMYPLTAVSAYPFVITTGDGSVAAETSIVYNYPNSGINFAVADGKSITANAPTDNTWHHIVVSRQGTTTRMFIDGVKVGTDITAAYTFTQSKNWYIGDRQDNAGGANYPFKGYIDDLRITKGLARYTQNFTPPTAALPTL